MWNCEVTNSNGYRAYADVYDEILFFLVYDKHQHYGDLLKNTRVAYRNCREQEASLPNTAPLSLVEPRDLLSLLNYVDVSPKLYFAPRPFARMGSIKDDFIYVLPESDDTLSPPSSQSMNKPACSPASNVAVTSETESDECCDEDGYDEEDDEDDNGDDSNGKRGDVGQRLRGDVLLSCLFCGSVQRIPGHMADLTCLNRFDIVPETAMSDVTKWRIIKTHDIGGDRWKPVMDRMMKTFTRKQDKSDFVHDHFCPLNWLSDDANCRWPTKHSLMYVNEPSRLKSALRMIDSPAKSENEWIEFVWMTTGTTLAQGACEYTLDGIYKRLMSLKLRHTSLKNLIAAEHFIADDDVAADQRNTSPRSGCLLRSRSTLQHATRQGSPSVVDYVDDERSRCYSDRYETQRKVARKSSSIGLMNELDLCVSIYDSLEKERSTSSKHPSGPSNTDGVFRIDPLVSVRLKVLHGFVVGRPDVQTCLFCGRWNDNAVLPWDKAKDYYKDDEKVRIVGFAINKNSGADQKISETCTIAEVARSLLTIHELVKNKVVVKGRCNEEEESVRSCIRLSASYDSSHRESCLYKLKRPHSGLVCAICLCDNSCRAYFNCGHWLCFVCYDNIKLTGCIICSVGVRRRRVFLRLEE